MQGRRSSRGSRLLLGILLAGLLAVPVAAMAQSDPTQTPPGTIPSTTPTTTPSDTAAVVPTITAPSDTAAVVPTTTAPAVTPATTPSDTAAPVPATTAPAVTPAPAPEPTYHEDAGMFSKGRKRITITGGWGQSFDDDYLLLGIGFGYFMANGLDVGVDFEGWLLGEPHVYKLSPRIDYVAWQLPRLKPYFGAFYRRSFVTDDLEDLDSLGGRAGAFYRGGRGGMAGAGVVYERYMNYNDSMGGSADLV